MSFEANRNNDHTTGKAEMEKIVSFLQENGYEFEAVGPSPKYEGYMVANFNKEIQYTDTEGEWIPDRHLKVTIEFDSDYDYKTAYRNKSGDYVYNATKGLAFVDKLMKKSYGGTRKRRRTRKP